MPSRMIHYAIANRILSEIGFACSRFVCGNLAPDAHDNTADGIFKSHFYFPEELRITEYLDIDAFETQYVNTDPDMFILGYLCHLITDNDWQKRIATRYCREFDTLERPELIKLFYQDYKFLNRILVEKYELPLLSENAVNEMHAIPIDAINSSGMQIILNNFVNDFSSLNDHKKLHLLKEEFVFDFIEETTEMCLLKIGKYIRKDHVLLQ